MNELMYYLIRIKQPEICVETGVCDGFSSSFTLKAMRDNNKGRLYSIDLPTYAGDGEKPLPWASIPNNHKPGWIVPDGLRDRWTLKIGSSKDHLKPLLKKLKNIPMFFHDSDHSYDYMLWEFNTVYPYLEKNAFLVSHDADTNPSFQHFAEKINREYLCKFGTAILKI
jgi:hypothetical protein